jgi:hypothetical protein
VPRRKEGKWDGYLDPRLASFVQAYSKSIGSAAAAGWDKKDEPLTVIMFVADLPKGAKDESIPVLTEPLHRILEAKVSVMEHKY